MSPSTATPAQITALASCAAVLLPADPPRTSRIAFWRPDGTLPDALLAGTAGPGPETEPDPDHDHDHSHDLDADGPAPPRELTVVLPDEAGTPARRRVPVHTLPVAEAVPVLTRARAARTGSAAAFWGAAAVLALQLAARGRLLPSVTAEDGDAWRLAPLDAADLQRVRELAAAMPPYARAVPIEGPDEDPDDSPAGAPALLPEPEQLLRAFLDAVADGLPRTPAAHLATGTPAFTAPAPQRVPALRPWAEELSAAYDSGVRISLRIEASGLPETARPYAPPGPHADTDRTTTADDGTPPPRFLAVVQVHSAADPAVVTDARALWSAGSGADGAAPPAHGFGPRAQPDTLLALRRAAAVWEPLSPLLSATVPDAVDLGDEELGELLSPGVGRALALAGVQVHWPKELVGALTTTAVVGPRPEAGQRFDGAPPSLLSPDRLLAFNWRFSVGDVALDRAELDRLAEAGRPLVRLRDRWVLLDPAALRRAQERKDRTVTPVEALGGVLGGTLEEDGEQVPVVAGGWLDRLREQLAAPPDTGPEPVPQPAALAVPLRDYQLRGLSWLHQLTSWGLGGCLADDMGLGKTITLIAFHLHRQDLGPRTAGPTLVVCPASLLGNWQREIEKFAPGTAVRRFHGSARNLADLAPGEFVLTTYGTMRLDAAALAEVDWGLVTADEAQHVKNPFSATAKALRSVPGRARIALTGTPVENNLTELWAVLDWASPGLLGSLPAFRRRYADRVEAGTRDPAGAQAAAQLARLVRPFLLRRRKSDPGVAPELPPKTETDLAVPLTPEQAGLYEAVVREGLAEVADADGPARRGLVVKLLTSLKQICNHPAQFLKEEDPRLVGRSGKWELFDELLDTLLAEGASVLVFTQYVRLARLLERHLADRGVGSLLLHGGTPVARREELVRSFQAGEAPVFLLSLKAAGTGLNLTRAAHVVHFDRWWNPAVEAQATDRAHRIGQQQPVQVHRLIAEGTVEDRIAELLERKKALADSVLSTGEAALTELSDAELTELVRLRGAGR